MPLALVYLLCSTLRPFAFNLLAPTFQAILIYLNVERMLKQRINERVARRSCDHHIDTEYYDELEFLAIY